MYNFISTFDASDSLQTFGTGAMLHNQFCNQFVRITGRFPCIPTAKMAVSIFLLREDRSVMPVQRLRIVECSWMGKWYRL